ncbi:MAG: efflux RND transporter periplasmic adaptor subunit [Rhodospirillaceae bacterium]
MKRTSLITSAILVALWGGAPRAAEKADLLELSAAQVKGLALKFVAAEKADAYLVGTVPAIIAPPPDARIAVAATFPGTVLQTLAVEGDAVKKGQPLAIIASREILTLSAELAGARARLSAAGANAKRQSTLSEEGIVSGARAEEADAVHQQARAEVDEKSRMLAAVNADGVKGTYTLSAPLDGVVAVSRLETGAPVDGMAPAFVVDATDRYEIQAQVPERLIGKIEPGMRVVVDGKIEAKVTSVGKVLNPGTRSAALKAAVAKGTELVAGRTASAAIYANSKTAAVSVPRAAVTELGDGTFVFVRAEGGVLVRKVEATTAAGAQIVILSGLRAGEDVAVNSLSELKSLALAK